MFFNSPKLNKANKSVIREVEAKHGLKRSHDISLHISYVTENPHKFIAPIIRTQDSRLCRLFRIRNKCSQILMVWNSTRFFIAGSCLSTFAYLRPIYSQIILCLDKSVILFSIPTKEYFIWLSNCLWDFFAYYLMFRTISNKNL